MGCKESVYSLGIRVERYLRNELSGYKRSSRSTSFVEQRSSTFIINHKQEDKIRISIRDDTNLTQDRLQVHKGYTIINLLPCNSPLFRTSGRRKTYCNSGNIFLEVGVVKVNRTGRRKVIHSSIVGRGDPLCRYSTVEPLPFVVGHDRLTWTVMELELKGSEVLIFFSRVFFLFQKKHLIGKTP